MQARPLASLAFALLLSACKKGPFEGEIMMHTTASAGPAQDMTVKVKGDRMRFDMKMPDGSQVHGIYDPTTNKLMLVKDADKAYTTIDFGKPGAPQANTSPDTASVDKTGKHETVAGMDCEDWTAKDPSGKRSEVCIAQGLVAFDFSALKGGGTSTLGKELREKKLFPLRSVEYDAAGKELSRMEVTKVEKKSLEDSEFEIPKDYTAKN